jgi:hypothetical protein
MCVPVFILHPIRMHILLISGNKSPHIESVKTMLQYMNAVVTSLDIIDNVGDTLTEAVSKHALYFIVFNLN